MFSCFGGKKKEKKDPAKGIKPVQTEESQAVIDEQNIQTLIRKLKNGNKQAQNMPEDELTDWARSLSVKSDLIEWYLNPEFASTLEAVQKLENLNASVANKPKTGFMQSTAESVPESVSTVDGNDLFDDLDWDLDEIKEENDKGFMKVGKTIKIKLVVAEICKSDAQKALRKMLSPVLTKIDAQQQFGMFHSALVVGPWYLEWNNSSLCIPRKCYSSAAMLAADLEFAGTVKHPGFELNSTIDKVAEVILDWNINRTYDQRTNNCQQFVDDLCIKLGIPIKFEGPLGDYLQNLREKGECDLSFPISEEMRDQLGIRETKCHFNTHSELDKFVLELQNKDPQFEMNYYPEWNLLKSFDRAFWLRHFKHEDNDKFTPEHNCPFGDPTQSTSKFLTN
jgi:hypothetical protein